MGPMAHQGHLGDRTHQNGRTVRPGENCGPRGRTGGTMNDSMVYTIGTALFRAHDHGLPVAALVEGQWLRGTVSAVDSHGLLLTTDELEHAVIRLEQIAVVRILQMSPPPS